MTRTDAELELGRAEQARLEARVRLKQQRQAATVAERHLMEADERVSRARAILASFPKAA